MTPEQRAVLQSNLKDDTIFMKGIEYPAHSESESGDLCLKLTTMVLVNEVARTWVDWYDRNGRQVNTREITVDYDRPSFSERRDDPDDELKVWLEEQARLLQQEEDMLEGVSPYGPETAFGGLIGQQPY